MEKDKQRKKYITKYKQMYALLLESNPKKAEDIIGKLADCCVYIDECNEHLAIEGLVVEMPQGNYYIMRENPYSKTFNDKMKIYNQLIKMLDDMMPSEKAEQQAKAGEALKAFLDKGKPAGTRS